MTGEKLCIPSAIYLEPFCFWADWAFRAVQKNSAILLKYQTFEGGFSCFDGKTDIELDCLYIAGSAQKI